MRRRHAVTLRPLVVQAAAYAVAAALLGVLASTPAAPAGAQGRGNDSAPTTLPALPSPPPIPNAGGMLSRSAHVAFGRCSAPNVTLTVSIARGPFVVGHPVTYAVVLTNHGGTACAPVPRNLPGGSRTLTVGPCGQIPATVFDASGRNVYPGRVAFSCPMYVGAQLGAHATLTARGSWVGEEALGGGPDGSDGAVQWREAPAGSYHVTVDGVVSVPITLVAPAAPR